MPRLLNRQVGRPIREIIGIECAPRTNRVLVSKDSEFRLPERHEKMNKSSRESPSK